MKKCLHCHTDKLETDYYSGLNVCKPCKIKQITEWRNKNAEKCEGYRNKWKKANPVENKKAKQKWAEANPHKISDKRLRYLFGMTLDDYNALLEEQNYSCAVCGSHCTEFDKRLCVDHNHKTKDIRGLLCRNCNTALGLFKDSPTIIESALYYLESKGHYGPKAD